MTGSGAYLDTAFIDGITNSQLLEIVRKHGRDKIVFGSDFPWARARRIKEIIEESITEPETKQKIYYENAKRLLRL